MFSRSVSTNNDRDCSLSSVPHFDATTHVVIRGHAFPSSISVGHLFLDCLRKALFIVSLIVVVKRSSSFSRSLVLRWQQFFSSGNWYLFCDTRSQMKH